MLEKFGKKLKIGDLFSIDFPMNFSICVKKFIPKNETIQLGLDLYDTNFLKHFVKIFKKAPLE